MIVNGRATNEISSFVKDMVEGESTILEVGKWYIHEGDIVQITDGQFWGTYGLSNFWYWKKLKKDGTLSEETFHGYGRNGEFRIIENKEEGMRLLKNE